MKKRGANWDEFIKCMETFAKWKTRNQIVCVYKANTELPASVCSIELALTYIIGSVCMKGGRYLHHPQQHWYPTVQLAVRWFPTYGRKCRPATNGFSKHSLLRPGQQTKIGHSHGNASQQQIHTKKHQHSRTIHGFYRFCNEKFAPFDVCLWIVLVSTSNLFKWCRSYFRIISSRSLPLQMMLLEINETASVIWQMYKNTVLKFLRKYI